MSDKRPSFFAKVSFIFFGVYFVSLPMSLWALAPETLFCWEEKVQAELDSLEALSGMIQSGPQKKIVNSLAPVFCRTVPPLVVQLYRSEGLAALDFAETLVRLRQKKLCLFFSAQFVSKVESLQKGEPISEEDTKMLWQVYLDQYQRLRYVWGSGVENSKKQKSYLFYRLLVAEHFARLFQAYLEEKAPDQQMKETLWNVSLQLVSKPGVFKNIVGVVRKLDAVFGKISLFSSEVRRQWLVTVYEIAIMGERVGPLLSKIIFLLERQFGCIRAERDDPVRKQWLMVLYQIATKRKEIIDVFPRVIKILNKQFGLIQGEPDPRIRRQWLITVGRVAKKGDEGFAALAQITSILNQYFGEIKKEKNALLRQQWLIAVDNMAVKGGEGAPHLLEVIKILNHYFGPIKEESDVEWRQQWLVALYNIVMKGAHSVIRFKKILENQPTQQHRSPLQKRVLLREAYLAVPDLEREELFRVLPLFGSIFDAVYEQIFGRDSLLESPFYLLSAQRIHALFARIIRGAKEGDDFEEKIKKELPSQMAEYFKKPQIKNLFRRVTQKKALDVETEFPLLFEEQEALAQQLKLRHKIKAALCCDGAL